MKTALYVRVSTDFQAEKGYSIEDQLDKLHAYCTYHNINNSEDFIDAGFSASNLNRPELSRLIDEIKLGIIDNLIVCKLDRLSRRTKDTLYLFEDVFTQSNITFISISEKIDTSVPSGKLFLTMLSSIAQFERENILERTVSGINKKADLGIKSKTPKILIGYNYDDKLNSYVINDYEAMQIREIFTRYLNNDSISNIFKFLNENYTTKYGKYKSIRSIQHILDNETYIGKQCFRHNYINAKNVPPIIDEKTFLSVKTMREDRKKNYCRHTSGYLLTDLLFCGECKSRLRGFTAKKANGPQRRYYVCYSRDSVAHPHMNRNNGKKCLLPYIRYEDLNNIIYAKLNEMTEGDALFRSENPNVDSFPNLKTVENEIEKLTKHAEKIVDLLLDENLPKDVFISKLEKINLQKEKLFNILISEKKFQKAPKSISHEDLIILVSELMTSEMDCQREILRKIIEKITVFKDNKIVIHWKI